MDRNIVRELQSGIPIGPRPYELLAGKLGIPEEEIIEKIRQLITTGVIRKLGAILHHQKVGYHANAMVVWKVPEKRVQAVGSIMASFQEVSHCYQRPVLPGWPYNLYTMIHSSAREELDGVIGRVAEAGRVFEYEVLYSTAELKKTGVIYFTE
jgi:DNA-binding Lrp family transcriptional regulator